VRTVASVDALAGEECAVNESESPTPAHAYQDYFVPAIFEPLAAQVLGCAAPEPGDRCLDLACGTGVVARALAARVGPAGRVVGVDVNPMMLEVARTVSAPEEPRIEWCQGDATDLDLADRSFDVVSCQQALQFFPDRAAGAREMKRVLVPGGRAVVAVWEGIDRHPMYEALADAEEPHLAALGVELTREELIAPFTLGDAHDLRDLLAGAGFEDVRVVQRSIDARFATPERFVERMEFAYAAVIPQFAESPEAFEAYLDVVTKETTGIVERYRQGDHIVVPMHANVAIAR
jgi:SAM-dependent methyltransferase